MMQPLFWHICDCSGMTWTLRQGVYQHISGGYERSGRSAGVVRMRYCPDFKSRPSICPVVLHLVPLGTYSMQLQTSVSCNQSEGSRRQSCRVVFIYRCKCCGTQRNADRRRLGNPIKNQAQGHACVYESLGMGHTTDQAVARDKSSAVLRAALELLTGRKTKSRHTVY